MMKQKATAGNMTAVQLILGCNWWFNLCYCISRNSSSWYLVVLVILQRVTLQQLILGFKLFILQLVVLLVLYSSWYLAAIRATIGTLAADTLASHLWAAVNSSCANMEFVANIRHHKNHTWLARSTLKCSHLSRVKSSLALLQMP